MERDLYSLEESRENGEDKINNLSQVITKGAVAAAGINVDTPIVTAIIGNLTGTLSTKKKSSKQVNCKICKCSVSSHIIYQKHIKGAKHQKKLKDLEVFSKLINGENVEVQKFDENQSFPFLCKICPMFLNSANQLQYHLLGERHRKSVSKLKSFEVKNNENNENNSDKLSKNINLGAKPPQKKKIDRVYPCLTCNILLNSKIQRDEHFHSKKHKTKEANWQKLQQSVEESLLQ